MVLRIAGNEDTTLSLLQIPWRGGAASSSLIEPRCLAGLASCFDRVYVVVGACGQPNQPFRLWSLLAPGGPRTVGRCGGGGGGRSRLAGPATPLCWRRGAPSGVGQAGGLSGSVVVDRDPRSSEVIL